MSDLPQPRMSPGVKETLDALYEASGQRESRPDFLAKLFAPIPMEAELGAAGLAPQEARFIAGQLAQNDYALVKMQNAASDADEMIDQLNALCESFGCKPGTDRLVWLKDQLSNPPTRGTEHE